MGLETGWAWIFEISILPELEKDNVETLSSFHPDTAEARRRRTTGDKYDEDGAACGSPGARLGFRA